MDSDQPQTNSSGLTRYRSAPSSYFNDVIDREFYEHIFNRPSSPETERVFSRFMNSLGGEEEEEESMDQIQKLASPKQEINQEEHATIAPAINNNNYEFYENTSVKPPLPNQNVNSGGGNNSNLIRHSSSPAGFFSQFNIENEYAAIRNMGTLGAANNSMEEAKFSNARRLKNPQNFSSVRMSSIAEIGDKVNRENNPQSENIAEESHGNDFMTGFGSWDDSSIVPDNVGGLKRFRDNDVKPFSGLNSAKTQSETGQSPAPLAHQMSLPNTSSEMAAIEKFLQFSDSIPCKIRAKRGCATHPRSIAERVRRTKISERMRKLQDLVPNMDKQTNTADMLDLAVDYIKELQKQVQTLSDCQAKCTCSHEQHQ